MHRVGRANTIRIKRSNISNRYRYSKKIFGPDITTLTISNEEMNDIMKIIKSFEDTGLLIKGVGETIENEAREQKRGFLDMF